MTTDRIPPRALDPEGVADGDYALAVSGGRITGLAAATGGGGTGVPAGGTTGQVLAKTSNADYDTGWATPSGGSGGGSSTTEPDGKGSFDQPPVAPNSKDDEFSDLSGQSGPANGLDAKWTKRNLGTAAWAALDDSLAPGCLLFDLPAGSAQSQAVLQPVPAGDFRLVAKATYGATAERNMWGLFVVDAAGSGIGICLDDAYSTDANTRLRELSGWTLGAATAIVRPFSQIWASGFPTWISLRKAGGVYYGAVWGSSRIAPSRIIEVPLTPTAFTPAHVGFGRMYGSNLATVALDAFRVTT